MRRIVIKGATAAAVLLLAAAVPSRAAESSLRFGRFGTVALYGPERDAAHVVLFVSGDGGWNKGVVDMARELASLDALVAGIDITRYLKAMEAAPGSCSYPAADFEELSRFIQKRAGRPRYELPVLVGYSSGATLVYAVLAQSPPDTFRGGISLGFCPDLPLRRPLCRGSGLAWQPGPRGKGYSFLPAARLAAPWVAFQGTIDRVCDAAATERFVKRTGGGEIVLLPRVGHGFSVPRNWMPQFREVFARLARAAPPEAAAPPGALSDVPLVELPPGRDSRDALAVIVSGDGGWTGIDREIGGVLAKDGMPVVGWNSLRYFWTPRTPEGAGRDLERVLRHYLDAWRKGSAILVGYSMGADVLPFMASRLPPDLAARVTLVALLGPGREASFEFHVSEWLGVRAQKEYPVLPEVAKLKGRKILCFHGKDEPDSLCPSLPAELATPVPLGGGHHFGGDYDAIAKRILAEAGIRPQGTGRPR